MVVKGVKAEITFPIIIFLLLNIAFFSILIYFVAISVSGTGIYEQTYAKEIALTLSSAKNGTTINFNIEELVVAANKNSWNSDLVKIDSDAGSVVVKLSDKSGYRFNFFTDYDLDYSFEGNNLQIVVGGLDA